jgi:hypothetical protein
VGRPRVDNVVCRCHSSQCLTTRLPDSGLVILVLRTPVHPPLQVTSFTPVSTAHTYISAYTPCSPQLSSNAQTKNHHRPQRSSRAPSKMPTPTSLLTLALALSTCSAQTPIPVQNCLGQPDGTPCTVEIKTDTHAGSEAKVGTATGQCYALVPGTQEGGFVSLS